LWHLLASKGLLEGVCAERFGMGDGVVVGRPVG